MELYSFFKSTASFRVRIVLALKGIGYHTTSIDLLTGNGENNKPAFIAINPQRLLPVLVTDNGNRLLQSGAICEFLDECYPLPSLLPSTPEARAYVRSLMGVAACDTHPLHTGRVTRYLARELHMDADSLNAWSKHWLFEGLQAFERILVDTGRAGVYCNGDAPTLADAFLVPLFVGALANGIAVDSFRVLPRIARVCLEHPAFRSALPQNQPDAAPATRA